MPPLTKRPGGIPGWQLGLVPVVGIIGFIYIWKPAFAKKFVTDPAEKLAAAAREDKQRTDQ